MNKELYDLTNPQKSIWLTEQFYKGTSVNNVCGTVLIDEIINFDHLLTAINIFIRDNDSFRIHIKIDTNGNVKQYFSDHIERTFEVVDVANNEELITLEHQMATTPFDVIENDLFDIKPFRFPNGKGGFVVNTSHLVADACTASLVASKIMNIYSSLIKGEQITEPATSYVNYINSEKEYLTSPKFEKDKEYWDSQFNSIPEFGTIPSLKSSTAESSSACRQLFKFDSSLVENINLFCKDKKISLFNFFMGIYALYIGRVSNLDNFVLGTPILNRTTFTEKTTPGMFISTVPFKFSLSGDDTFVQYAQKIGLDSLSMFRHQKYPYQNILEHIRKTNPSQPNLYDILISYQNSKTNRTSSNIPYMVRWTFNHNVADSMQIHIFDMNDEGELNIAYDYRTSKYDVNDINSIHSRILNIINQILENPEILISNIEIITPIEKKKILDEFNNTNVNFNLPNSILDFIEKVAYDNPEKIAIESANEFITYGNLMARVNQLANHLLSKKITENNNIGILTSRSIDTIVAILATLKINCTYVPIDPEYPVDRISYMIDSSGIKYILLKEDFDNITQNLSKFYIDYRYYSDEPTTFNNTFNYDNNNNLYIIFTSGSTGKPKGVTISHKNMMNLICFEKYKTDLLSDPNTKILQFATMSFDVSYQEIFSALMFGNTLVLIDDNTRKNMSKLSSYIVNKNINTLFIPPAYLKLLVEDDNIIASLSKVLKNIVTAGEALIITTGMEKLILNGVKINNHYGPAETHVATTFVVNKNNVSIHPPIGCPISNAKIYILDSNNHLCPIGVTGQIAISGDCVGNGYWNRPNLTTERFISDPYSNTKMYLTGDLGYFDNTGNVHYIGRSDFQVKINGFRIELGEIDQVLIKNPNVKSCVTVIHEENNKKYIVTYYIEENSTKEEELIKYLKVALPFYMIPKKLVKLKELPINSNGKIDRKKLPKFELAEMEEYLEPTTPTELRLVKIWKDLFDADKIGANYNFFNIGGDSLLAIKLSSIISSAFKVTITVGEIYSNPTIRELSILINKKQQVENGIISSCKKKDFYHLSSAQSRVYYSSKMSGENSILYNMPGAIIFDKKPDVNKLDECFKKLIKRHSSLRTCFEVIDNEVYQKVLDTVSFEVVEKIEKNKTIDEVLKEFVKPFDLAKAPLFRASLVTLKDGVLLLFDMHHIISDGLSLSILTTELCKLYNGDELTENKLQYIDYAECEYKNLKENNMQESKNYWINQFKNDIPVLNLPTDYTRPAVQSFEGSKVYKIISNPLTKKISSLAKKLDVSNYMLLLACYYVLLSKYTSQEDIVVGTPVVGRDKEELLDMIGMFVNSLPLKNHIESSMSFDEFLKSVKANSIEALSHQLYPFDELVSNLNISRDNSRNPIFDTMFTYQNNGYIPLNFEGINSKYYIPDTKISKFDLSLEVVPTDTEFKLTFEYCTKLFNKETIERFSTHFINILEKIVDNYKLKIADIDILSDDERNKILYEFNDTKMDYPKDKTIIELFEEQVEKTPDNIAVVFEDKKLTYRELNERANQLAWYLRKIGLKRNDIVSIMINRSLELLVSIIGVLKSGACYIPIDPNYPKDRIQYMLENSNSKILLADNYLYNTIDFDNKFIVDLTNYKFEENKDNLPNINNSDDISYIIYTSGSTGIPKGVVLKQSSLTNLTYYLNNHVCFLKDNKYISMASVTTASFDIFIFETLISLQKGLKVVIANEDEQRLPSKLNLFIKNNNIKAIQMTPSRMRMFLDAIKDCPNLSNLEYVVLAGEPLPYALLRELLQLGIKRVYNGYGPSETTVFSSFTDVTNYPVITIGRPIANTQMYILDKDFSPVPVGIPGELYIAGEGIGKGYLNNEKNTKERFIINPFEENSIMYKTGDICKFLDNGEIAYLERLDNQVKIRGLRIELEEIENKLLEIPFIKKVKVVKQSIENRDFISAYYVSTSPLKVNDIRRFLSTSLPDYMIPSYFTALEDFPYTPNGKIDKNALPLPDISSETNSIQYIAPRNNTEISLVSLLEKILKVSPISILDNFFDLGGDSLTAIVLCTNIKQTFDIELSFKDVINNPIVEDLAIIIANAKSTTTNTSSIKSCAKRDYYPASSAQKRMYLASKMDNNSTLYNIAGGILLDTMPDINRLQNVFDTIVARHESLRTYFEVINGNIVQKILDHLEVRINVENVETNNIDELFTKYQSIFDLNRAPLFKVFLLILPNHKVLFMLDIHHIIFDGASLNVLMQEVSALYNEKELPKLDISYKDFAVWEEEQLLKDGFKDSKEFWIKQFADDIPILNMPTTYPRPASKSYEGTTFVTMLSKDFTTKINNFANKYNVTPYMLMLCVYYILLYKYTNQEDIVVGSPITGRSHAGLEPLLGMFVNSIPLKANISSNVGFKELLLNIKDTCVNAFAHQDYPFDVLVNDLNITRDASRNPLFDTMFIYQNNGFNTVNLDGINADVCTPTSHTSKFDISVEVVPVNNELKLSFEYCLKLFDEEFIINFAKHYENILNVILEHPDIKIADICMLGEKEKSKILYEFNDTHLEYDKSKTVIDHFEKQVNKTPNNIALVFEDKSFTYNELNEKANQLAHYLYNSGVKLGDSIGILVHRCPEMIIGIIAILKVGASYIPLDPEYPIDRINYILEDSNTKKLLVHSSTLDLLSDDKYEKINIDIDSDIFRTDKVENLDINIPANNLIYMIYTSGSTGNPKGVMVTHKNINNFILAVKQLIDFSESKVMLSVTTICFDIFALEIWGSLTSGIKLVLANDEEQLSPNLLRTLCLKNKVNMVQTTPSRYSTVLLGADNLDFFDNFTDIMVGGEAFPKSLLEKLQHFCKANIFNMYGPTETTVWSTIKDLTNVSNVTIGKPIANTTCYILDKDKNLLPPYVPGELYIGGDGVTNGYWKRDELTKEKFIASPFRKDEIIYNTNDLAYFTEDGEIVHLGRTDFQVKIRGYRIELEEIENCILKYPNIEKCIITPDKDRNNRQFIVAYLCVNDRISINKLKMFLKSMLPKYMVPSYFMILDKIPYLSNGKIDKKALPKVDFNKSTSEKVNYIAPRNKLELQITDIFQNLLSISPIGIDDNFFELGGDSLLAINLQVELLKLNLNITYSDIFIKPTVRELATKISSSEAYVSNSIDTNEFLGFNTILDNTCNMPQKLESIELENILITGTTGFLGAHVLDNFLKTEKGIAYCLIRTESGLTLENKLIKKLHFYFGDKYDKYIGNRIIIVNGDIVKNNLGLSSEELNSIANNISCVINCAAKVTHFGNYNAYKEVNVDGTENLLKFCTQFNKRFYQVSTLSVSGNNLENQSYMEQSFEHDVIFRENNFYINQSLDNVYVRSKFEAEKLVLQYILKGLDAYILRVGNLMNRYEDGKFQPNVDENAYIDRLLSLTKIGCIPDYLSNNYLEFTPIDSCAEAIIKIVKHPNKENRIFHLYDNNHVDVIEFIRVLNKYIPFDIVSNDEFVNKVNNIFKQKNSDTILSGILRDFDVNRRLVYESKVKLRSEFTIEYLSKIGFKWPNIDEKYLVKFLDYFCSTGYIKREEKK